MCTERKATGEYVLACFMSATMEYGPAYEIVVLIAYEQKPRLTEMQSRAIGLMFRPSLPLLQCNVYAKSEGSGETAHMRRLACAFATRSDKYKTIVCWRICM